MESARKDDHIVYDPATGRMLAPPRQLFLELTGRCNLCCVHCPVDYGTSAGRARGELPFETIERLMPWLREAHSVNLNVVGEPLIYSRFLDVLALFGDDARRVHFNTNGMALTPRLARELVGRRVGSVIVSVDGIETNEALRGVPYEKLRAKIELLCAEKRAQGSAFPLIGVAFTILPRNRFELPLVLEDLAPLGIQAMHIQPLMLFYEGLRDENVYTCPGLDEGLQVVRRRATELGIEMNVFRSRTQADERHTDGDDVRVQLGGFSPTYGCSDPFYEMKILSTGQVQACSRGVLTGLNVNEHELDALWNHPWYLELRKRLHAARFEGPCLSCPYIFGSRENQAVLFRPGVHHSHEHRLALRYTRPARFSRT